MLNAEDRMPMIIGTLYITFQFLGAFFGRTLAYYIQGNEFAPFYTTASKNLFYRNFFGEFLGTSAFVLCFLILNNPETRPTKNKLAENIFITGALIIGRNYASISGGCLNSAMGFAFNIFNSFQNNDSKYLFSSWL